MKKAAILWLLTFSAVLPASVAQAAPGDGWASVWSPIGSNMLDQSRGPLDPNHEREYPPYKPEWEAKYVAVLNRAKQGEQIDPTTTCVPGGVPRLASNPYPFELIVTLKQVWLLQELQSQVRRIYTDGRKPDPDLDPTFNGYSTGHWEGDTLLVETVGLRGDTVFDRTGAPHSDQMKVVERMRLRSPDTWENQITIIDPVAFTKPWVVTRVYKREPDWQIAEYVCEDNNRNRLGPAGGSKAERQAAEPPSPPQ